jgi:hypothetical protein
MSTTLPSRDPIDRIRPDVIKAMAVRAALQLGVFTPLAGGPMTGGELAKALGVKPRRLELLLYQLVAADFLELRDGRFANTPMADHYLVQGSKEYYGGVHGVWTEQFTALLKTADSIRADKPEAKIDFSGMTQEELGGFLRGIHGMAIAAGRTVAEHSRFADAQRVADIGGGSGGVAIGLCETHPNLHATVIDFPSVVPIAQEMAAEAGLEDRVTTMTANVLEGPLPGGFDVATARAFFQVLSEDQCQTAAHNIAAALPSGGTLFVIGFVADDSRLSPEVAIGMNMVFLNNFDDGEAYTASQYETWLGEAGFTDIVQKPFLAGNSLITARKA